MNYLKEYNRDTKLTEILLVAYTILLIPFIIFVGINIQPDDTLFGLFFLFITIGCSFLLILFVEASIILDETIWKLRKLRGEL